MIETDVLGLSHLVAADSGCRIFSGITGVSTSTATWQTAKTEALCEG
jgi:hypothetical protein